MKLSAALTVILVALAPSGLIAQGRSQERARPDTTIPRSSIPPAGMCRIWLDAVPAAQQPAPTDCATAVRNRPAKGRVIFGDDYVKGKPKVDSGKGKPPVRGFAPKPLRKRDTTRPPRE